MIASDQVFQVNTNSSSKILTVAILATILAIAPMALADDMNTAPDPVASAELSESNQILEIPQQCDKDSVAVLCDHAASSTADPSASSDPAQATAQAPANQPDPSQAAPANDADVGSIDDYQNQNAPAYVAVPEYVYVPQYTYLAPAPVIVSNGSFGGPRYVSPMPLGFQPGGVRPGGFAGFGPRPFGGGSFGRGVGTEFGGGHFAGRR